MLGLDHGASSIPGHYSAIEQYPQLCALSSSEALDDNSNLKIIQGWEHAYFDIQYWEKSY